MDSIPPLTDPADLPPVHTQEDLHQLWRMLMGPLGFGRRSLWLHLLDAAHRPTRVILQIEDIPRVPEPSSLDSLMHMCGHLISEGAGGSVVFLLTGPGRSGISDDEREWARRLQSAVRRAGLEVWPVHRANDRELRVCAPDDLAASA